MSFTAITALAMGQHTDQLQVYIWGAPADGVPAREIHDVPAVVGIYAGFTVALTSSSVRRPRL
jgi:alkylhydroperoxidase/carboxymuconolactone decarboxylase family protein YurZ